MSKLNLPLSLTGESLEYQRLYNLTGSEGRNMTTIGEYTFTSLSSLEEYSTTTGGEYNVFLQLQTVLEPYNLNEIDFNSVVNTLNDHISTDASTTAKGHVELATPTETTTGIDATRAVTPLGLKSATDLLIPLSQKGTMNGVATLGPDGKHTASQVPNIIFKPGDVTAYYTSNFQTQSTSYVKLKEFPIGCGGGVRISFTLKTTNNSMPAYARIYKNNTPVGTERTTSSTSGVTYIEDIAGFSAGDLIQIYAKQTNATYFTQVDYIFVKVESIPSIGIV